MLDWICDTSMFVVLLCCSECFGIEDCARVKVEIR